jgi:CRISPR-associated protein Cas2
MLVITLTDCPLGLRGYLTKWLLEINSGVFVGHVSVRVRESLWTRIVKKHVKMTHVRSISASKIDPP